MNDNICLTMIIPSELQYLATVGNTFEEFLKNCPALSDDNNMLGFKINLVLTEAIANAILHGHGNCTSNNVIISAEINDKYLTIEVKDCGKGFELPEFISNDPYGESGRGIYIIRQIMDEVKNIYEDNLHILQMKKNLLNNYSI